MDSFRKPIAIRSLTCPDHAFNIPPQVLSVLWFVGKRCNYDCSYCSPHSHDAVSPYLDLDRALAFADQARAHCELTGKRIKWMFTGGEPFIDPGFMQMCRHIHGQGHVEQMNVTTNGSLPLKVYQQAAEIFRGITFSLHLERGRVEIDRTVSLITDLHEATPDCFLSCNLMYLPGTTEWVKDIISTLEVYGVHYVLRKITPPWEWDDTLPYVKSGQGRKNAHLLDAEEQSQRKNRSYEISDISRAGRLRQYYSESEEEFLRQHSLDTPWQNMGVWYDDNSYHEINSDQLLAQEQNQFQGWSCYAGVDNIYVDFDGKIYRGFCLEGGAIAQLGDSQIFSDAPIQCQRRWCNCAFDIPVRKVSSIDFAHLINQQTDLASL